MDSLRFQRQLDFMVEADKVKHIVRKSMLFDGTRFENDAEHSWTVCLMVTLFQEYSNSPVNLSRVLHMLLIHDIVEIDAGDTFLYASNRLDAFQSEETAASRIFGILPDDQRDLFIEIWREFEARKTIEAKFAAVFDRLQPVYQNYKTEGFTWKQNGVTREMVLLKNQHIEEGSVEIWSFFKKLVDECGARGYFHEPEASGEAAKGVLAASPHLTHSVGH